MEILIGTETAEIIEKHFEYLLQKYQKDLKELMKGSEFVLDSVNLLYYKRHKISLNRSGSYIDSPKWLSNKKASINPTNNDGKCFQYAITVVLNNKQIKSHRERISNINPFINRYNWKERNISSHKNDWKMFESNTKLIDLISYTYLTIQKK